MTDFVLPTTPTEINLFSERESVLQDLTNAIVITRRNGQVSCNTAEGYSVGESEEILAWLPALLPENFGDPIFKSTYGVKYAYYAGAMAKGIASTDMVIALGKAGFFGSFGAAGVSSRQLEAAIHSIQAALPNGPYAFNLLSSPNEEALEQHIVDMYLKHGVHVVEAAAYMEITAPLVLFRCSGLSLLPDGEIKFSNRIIAKVSRMEVAEKFMQPAPEKIISRLVEDGRISRQQADLARCVPVADDITVEADSGGHTDNRPLVCLLPSMLRLRDEIQAHYAYAAPVRVGAAGGISNPTAALAAYMMGAAYIVTGSINQACVESGTSHHTKKLLAQAAMTNVAMAPSADMFEQGVRVQVLKLGTLYPMRAQKLYEFYSRYDSIDQIPLQSTGKAQQANIPAQHMNPSGKILSNISMSTIQPKSSVLRIIPNIKWLWFSAGIWVSLRSGQFRVKKDVKWITRFGVVHRWVVSMIGYGVLIWNNLRTAMLGMWLGSY